MENQATPAREDQLWVATFILMGLRFDDAFSRRLLEGAQGMKESVTYQSILREGMAEGRAMGIDEGREEARRLLMRQGVKRFGEPSATLRTRLEAA